MDWLKVQDKIEELSRHTAFSGVVEISGSGKTLCSISAGCLDRKNLIPNTRETLFGIASGTKLFTALGIGALIDDRKLGLDTRIKDLPIENSGFIDPEASLLQLLNHTSGIYDYYDEESTQDYDNFRTTIPWCDLQTPTDYLPLFGDQQKKFPAGERYSYSNGGYVFLGIIIEKISGQLYRDFIKERVLIPGGMPRSGFHAFNDLPENTANGYMEDGNTTNIYQLPLRGGGDGGLFTSAPELSVFWRNLFNAKIISKDLLDSFVRPQAKLNDHTQYGCGLYIHADAKACSIVGGDAGVGFYSRYYPEEDLAVHVLSNLTNGEEAMSEGLMHILYANPEET